jgi:hypothetical protein
MKKTSTLRTLALALAFTVAPLVTRAADPLSNADTATSQAASADELAKQLANPIAALISVPFQNNFDFGYANDGWKYTLNVQPVIPFSVSEDWNLISRTILPIVHQEDVTLPGTRSGLSDTVQSLWFSPKAPTSSGWIWGAGPVFLLPTATDDLLGTEKWGAGPTFVALKQSGPWTYGALANHIWSFAGEDSRADVNATFVQPFATYGIGKGQTVTLTTETTYDWDNEQWTVPVVFMYSKVTKIGSQMVSLSAGAKYYAEKPDGGPDWGLRVVVTFLFPK